MNPTTDPKAPRRIAYVGNFLPEHSTESHVARTLRRLGHHTMPVQENLPQAWTSLYDLLGQPDSPSFPHLVLWTRTGWDPPVPHEVQEAMLARCRDQGVPTVGFHLDRWWGLARQGQVESEPFFRCDLVATADGGHDAEWADAGVAHLWMPPAVAEWECGWGEHDRTLEAEVAFVGSWESYHPEWPWRRTLIRALQNRYGARRFRAWPERGQPIRGRRLRDLYASTTVVVGDSCLAGDSTWYWSDRVPETLGRGGLLIHPNVEGLNELFHADGQYETPRTMLTVEPEDMEAMFSAIEGALAMPIKERLEIQRQGMRAVMAGHTYRHRMETLLGHVAGLELGR